MTEQLINYETAKLAKEKGYDIKTYPIQFYSFIIDGEVMVRERMYNNNEVISYLTPSQSLLQKWLREKNIIIDIQTDQTSYPKYCFNAYKYEHFGNWEEIENTDWGLYSTYESVLDTALLLGLKNII
jgi:hypothetical protein